MRANKSLDTLSNSSYDSDRSPGTPGGYVPGPLHAHRGGPEPCEPDLRTCTRELAGHLFELGAVLMEIREGAFSKLQGQGGPATDQPDDSLEATLRRSCDLAARLVGEARTINAKLLG